MKTKTNKPGTQVAKVDPKAARRLAAARRHLEMVRDDGTQAQLERAMTRLLAAEAAVDASIEYILVK